VLFESVEGRWRWALAAGGLWFLMTLVQPFYMVIVYGVLGVQIVILGILAFRQGEGELTQGVDMGATAPTGFVDKYYRRSVWPAAGDLHLPALHRGSHLSDMGCSKYHPFALALALSFGLGAVRVGGVVWAEIALPKAASAVDIDCGLESCWCLFFSMFPTTCNGVFRKGSMCLWQGWQFRAHDWLW